MSQTSQTNYHVGSVFAQHLSTNTILIDKGTVTQLTSISTGVTINSNAGVITTVSSSLAAGGTASFTVSHSDVNTASVVVANISNYSGTTGIPIVRINAISNGSFDIKITNAAATDPLNGIIKISFIVV